MEKQISETNLNDLQVSVLTDFVPESKALLITFGGIQNRLPFPVFEFFRSLDKYRMNKIFVRDFKQCWYTQGLLNISANIDETKNYLQSKIEEIKPDKIVFIGNSAGGFTALLFGLLLEVDEVHAFGPQTFIDARNRLLNFDFRWRKEISNVLKDDRSKKYLDLKDVFASSTQTKTKFLIYYDSQFRLDRIHAARMKFKNVRLVDYKGGGHSLIKTLRDNGELDKIISGFTIDLTNS
jgi:hypothetical protein